MRLKTRLLLLLVPAITVTLILLTAVSYRNARWQAEELAEKTAQNIALEQSDKVFTVIRSAETAARSLAFAMNELRDSKGVDRDSMRQITRGFAASSTNYYGVWALWEPNAYDGKDDEFKGSAEHGNQEGRANAYWTCVDSCLLYDPSDNYDHEEYYKLPKERKKLTTVAPYRDMDTPNQVLMTTVAMPIMSSSGQKVLGVVGVDIELDFIHELLAGVKPFNTGYAMLVSDEGAIVAQPDGKDGKKGEKEASLPKVSDDVLQKIRKGQPFTTEIEDKDTGTEFNCFYTPLMSDGFSSPWYFMVALPMDEVMAQSRQELLVQLGISLLALLVLVGLVFYTANGVARPLQRIADYASNIAVGKYDTKEGEKDSVFEISELQTSLRTMLDSLLKSMGEAQKRTEEAAIEATRAREAVREADKARLVSEERHQAMVKVAERVDAVSQRLQETSVHLSQSIAVAGNESQEQNSLMAETVTAISGMSDSISRVSANTQDTARFSEETGAKARQGAEVVNATIAAFDSIREETDALSSQIEDLSKRTEGIGSILAIINDIADQTNLLALNAAIEAARAGEYGRGFAVVADEVRKLAEKTMQATQEVGQSVAGIRQSMRVSADSVSRASKTVHDTVALGHEARTSLDDIVNLVARMNDQIQDIAGLCQEQDQLGNQVAGIVDRLRQLSIVVSEAMEQGAEITRSLEPQAKELGVLVDQLSNS